MYFLGTKIPASTIGGAGDATPRGTPEGFLFVATKRNPSDSKEKNAFWVGKFGTRGIVVTKRSETFRLLSLRFMPD